MDIENGTSVQLLEQTVYLGTPAWSVGEQALLLAVEKELEWSWWISIMTLADQRLVKLLLTETLVPYSIIHLDAPLKNASS
jgi:hypothetical protein